MSTPAMHAQVEFNMKLTWNCHTQCAHWTENNRLLIKEKANINQFVLGFKQNKTEGVEEGQLFTLYECQINVETLFFLKKKKRQQQFNS